jgi:hypothetical protein
VVWSVILTRQQLHCPYYWNCDGLAPPQQGRAIQFWVLSPVTWEWLSDSPHPTLGGWLFAPRPALSAYTSPYLCSLRSVQCSLLSVVGYNSLFVFEFCSVGISICPGSVLGDIPRRWVGELCVVHGAHLLGLQIYTGSFETGEMVCCLFQCTYWDGVQTIGV